MKFKPIVLVGPTAIGKTAISLIVAERINAEIISADSRQIYRYMNIATAKPSVEEQRKIPHHFVDHIYPDEPFSAGQFGDEARECCSEITGRMKNIVVAGGSGLYIRALVDGFFDGVGRDAGIRGTIQSKLESMGIAAVYEELKKLDPAAAKRIHRNDARRIERALEVHAITGKPITEIQSYRAESSMEPVMIGLTCERAHLYDRIEKRIDKMIEEGVVDETKKLLEMGYSRDLVSMESLGYREILQYLDGDLKWDEMVSLFKQGSRNYAKRQWTWFRKDTRIQWLDVLTLSQEAIISEIIRRYEMVAKPS